MFVAFCLKNHVYINDAAYVTEFYFLSKFVILKFAKKLPIRSVKITKCNLLTNGRNVATFLKLFATQFENVYSQCQMSI